MTRLKRKRSARSGLFLIELIVAILFFSLVSSICIQLFVKAYLISTRSKDLTMALNHAQSVAEIFKSSNGTFDDVSAKLDGEKDSSTHQIILRYDNSWQSVSSDETFSLTLKLSEESPVEATVSVVKLGKNPTTIYEIKAKKYIQ